MTDTTFVAGTIIEEAWANDVNNLRYGAGDATRGSALLEYVPPGTGAVATDTLTELRNQVFLHNYATLQQAFDAAGTNGEVIVKKGNHAVTIATVDNANVTITMRSGSSLTFATVGATAAITVNADKFTIRGTGKIIGPTAAAYVASESAIKMYGTSSAARKWGLTVEEGIEIYNFGSYGLDVKWVDHIRVKDSYLHDIGYAGAQFQSCNYGVFSGNTIKTITPGSGGDMYGVAFTHDSTGYSSDPALPDQKAVANPFCQDWDVYANKVSDINWEGIDCHGGFSMHIYANEVYATLNGISCCGSSGDAILYAGYDNAVFGNTIDGRNADGSTSGRENLKYGINISGGTTVFNDRVRCFGNTILYKGLKDNTSNGAIAAGYVSGAIFGNTIDNWNGSAIYLASFHGTVSGNVIRSLADNTDTVARCINNNLLTTLQISVTGNIHDPVASQQALVGYSEVAGRTTEPWTVLTGNDFKKATTPFSLSVAGSCRGTDTAVYITDSGGTGSTYTIDLANTCGQDCSIYLTSAATYTISNLTNGKEGQKVTLIQAGSGSATLDRSNAALSGGASQTIASASDCFVVQLKSSIWTQITAVLLNS